MGETTQDLLERARSGDPVAFGAVLEPYRGELQVHCYRILGSLLDAEDVVQETLLAAWQGLDRFDGRASVRGWLYRIATNRSLNHLRSDSRRPRVAAPDAAPAATVLEPTWLQPYPDAALDGLSDQAPGPDARYESTETISLAFVAALQHLPPRQRAVLVLRDVLGFRAAEVATILDISEAAVTSALRRARGSLASRLPVREGAPPSASPVERELAGRFAVAFERGDIPALVALLTDDARLSMPPLPVEYLGRSTVGGFLRAVCHGHGAHRYRLIPTRANGQPAFGCYVRDPYTPIAHAHGLLVLTLSGNRITDITQFFDTGVLAHFGLPRTLPL
ncbi:MAG TPA: sigma-70 family RNA polymerase sigma factor [Actinophytocola sp.]|nr:sigma-70 family RNA polymerase sigma factor [Actinophytocola sp.]